jgi:hypothetical protein
MPSVCKKYALLAMLVVALLSSTSTAGATTATITGGPSVSGSSFSTLLKLQATGKTLSCTSSSMTGSVVASATGAMPLRVGTITPAFSGCTIVGGLGITVSCQPAALKVTALTVSGATRAGISGITCLVFVTSQTACRFTVLGTVGATHSNGAAALTSDTNHQTLAAINSTNGSASSCTVLPDDATAKFTNNSAGDVTYNVSPVNLAISSSGLSPTSSFTFSPASGSSLHFPHMGDANAATATFHSTDPMLAGHVERVACTGSFTCSTIITPLTDGQTSLISLMRTGGTSGTLIVWTDFGPNGTFNLVIP